MIKSLADANDQLYAREQRDQHAGERYRRIKRGDRRTRRQPEAAKAPQIIDIAEPDQAERDAEHDDADDDLDDQPWRPVQRLGDRGQIQMIIAAGGDRGTNEDRIDEQGGGDLLQPQPGKTNGPWDDVEHHQRRKAE